MTRPNEKSPTVSKSSTGPSQPEAMRMVCALPNGASKELSSASSAKLCLRAIGGLRSLQRQCDLAEKPAPLFIVAEHVEAGARRGQQHGITRLCDRCGARDHILEGTVHALERDLSVQVMF